MGAGSYLWEGACGLGHCAYGVGELGYAGFQSAYYRDLSYFRNEWSQSRETLSNVGKALWDDPLGGLVPGVMEAWRNPTSPAAWGKAAVDIGLITLSAAKIGNAAKLIRVGRVGDEIATFGKTGSITRELTGVDQFSIKDIKTTAHGSERIAGISASRGGVLSFEGINTTKALGKTLTQADGATVYLYEIRPGRFNVVVQGQKGIITTMENWSQKSINRIAKNYGWKLE